MGNAIKLSLEPRSDELFPNSNSGHTPSVSFNWNWIIYFICIVHYLYIYSDKYIFLLPIELTCLHLDLLPEILINIITRIMLILLYDFSQFSEWIHMLKPISFWLMIFPLINSPLWVWWYDWRKTQDFSYFNLSPVTVSCKLFYFTPRTS